MTKKTPVFRILDLLKTRMRAVLFLLVLSVIAAGFDITVPFISQRLIDALITFFKNGGAPPFQILIGSAVAILVATVLNSIATSTYNYYSFKLATSTEDTLRHRVFEKYLRLHALFHHGSSSGQIIGRLDRGVQAVYAIIYDIFGQNLLPPLIIFIGILVSLVFKNPLIALIVFLPLPIYLFTSQRLTRRIYEIEKRAHDQFEIVGKESYDVASNVLTVKKFSQEAAEVAHQTILQKEAREIQYGGERLWSLIEVIQTSIAMIGRISVTLIGGFLVLTGRSTVGEFVLYVTLQNMAYHPISRLSILRSEERRNTARAERLFDVLDEPVKILDKPEAAVLSPFSRAIEFRDVWFQYSAERSWTLKNINVTIPANTTVALVGRSGSGKTTFINLLLRS